MTGVVLPCWGNASALVTVVLLALFVLPACQSGRVREPLRPKEALADTTHAAGRRTMQAGSAVDIRAAGRCAATVSSVAAWTAAATPYGWRK
jgi:hypothetical protein